LPLRALFLKNQSHYLIFEGENMSNPNPFKAPSAQVRDQLDDVNTSGQGKDAIIPEAIKGWSWGGFLWGWIWAIGNKTWIGLLALIPYVGLIVIIYLGIKGRELAWRNKQWDSVEHFIEVQRKWALWWLYLTCATIVIVLLVVALGRN
jgi:hypothetical protein